MSRANWNISYEKGLVNIMRDHVNIPMFRGQNGWTGEGWRSISDKFAQKFPLAHFTKQQLQEKEKDLKGNWKVIRDALKESGVSWNESLFMIIAGPDKWTQWKNTKVAKFQKKPFPLYEDCTLLYHGSVATGELNFTSTEHLQPAAPPSLVAPAAPPAATAFTAPPAPLAPAATAATTAVTAPAATAANSDSTSMFTSLDGLLDDSSARNEAQSAPSNEDHVQGSRGGRKRKQSHIGAAVEDWVKYKKTQSSKALEEIMDKKKKDEEFSVESCLSEVDAMDGLTDVDKAYAMTIFKTEIDREVFMKMKNKNVRLIWLKQQIRKLELNM